MRTLVLTLVAALALAPGCSLMVSSHQPLTAAVTDWNTAVENPEVLQVQVRMTVDTSKPPPLKTADGRTLPPPPGTATVVWTAVLKSAGFGSGLFPTKEACDVEIQKASGGAWHCENNPFWASEAACEEAKAASRPIQATCVPIYGRLVESSSQSGPPRMRTVSDNASFTFGLPPEGYSLR